MRHVSAYFSQTLILNHLASLLSHILSSNCLTTTSAAMEVAEAPAVEGASSEGPSQERRVALKENSIEFALPILRQMGERLQGFTVDSGFDAKDWLSSLSKHSLD